MAWGQEGLQMLSVFCAEGIRCKCILLLHVVCLVYGAGISHDVPSFF